MSNTWLKIKVWTKVSVFGLISLIVLIFLAKNWGTRVDIDFLFVDFKQSRLLIVLFLTAILSIFGWWIFKTIFKTVRQVRDVRRQAYIQRIEKEHAQMKEKAAKLQVKPEASAQDGL